MKRVNITIDKETESRLKVLKEKKGIGRSELIRRGIQLLWEKEARSGL